MYDLRRVGVRFGRAEVVKGVDLSLPATGVVALVGSNGAGKSTLLDALSGFLGHLGEVVERSSQQRLNRAALTRLAARLHQDVVLPEGITVGEFLSIAESPGRATCILGKAAWFVVGGFSARVEQAYGYLRYAIGDIGLHRSLDALSVGQRRAVALSGVLLAPKAILLLDEPFVGLSEAACEVARSMIQEEAKRRPVILAAHDLDLALGLATRVAVLVGGRIALDAPGSGLVVNDLLRYFG
jgi:ABC-type multidrug transport system ATPase subunit